MIVRDMSTHIAKNVEGISAYLSVRGMDVGGE